MGSTARLVPLILFCASTRTVAAKTSIPSEDANFISNKEREKRAKENSLERTRMLKRRARFTTARKWFLLGGERVTQDPEMWSEFGSGI